MGDREGGRHGLEVEKRVLCKVFSLLIHELPCIDRSTFSKPSRIMQ